MNDLIDSGMYVGTVVKAEIIDSEYMVSQYNPKGTCLNLWIDVPREDGDGTKRLFKRMNRTEANKLFVSVGEKAVNDLNTVNPSFLVKRDFIVEVEQYTSKAGKVSNIAKTLSPATDDKVDF